MTSTSSSHSISSGIRTFKMEYLESLSISELISYLKMAYRCANFKKVEQILISREEDMLKKVDDSEKKLELCKTKLSDLSMALEEKKKNDAEVEDKLGQLECDKIATEILVEKYKTICDELIEKVDRLEDDLGMCRGKSSELTIALEDKKKVSIEFEDKLCKLEGDKVASENELKEYKIVYEKLKEKVVHMEEDSKMVTERINFMAKDLQIYNDKFRELLIVLEEKKKEMITLQDMLQKVEILKHNAESHLRQYMNICYELKRKVAQKEEELKVVYERERMDTDRVNLLGKCWEVHKAKQYELSIMLEEKEKECIALKDKLGMYENDKIVTQNELREYKVICDVLKEKLTRVEESCKIVYERERTAMGRIKILSGELEKSNKDKEEKLTKLNEENTVLKCEKRKAEDELEAQNERYKLLETRVKMLECETSEIISAKANLEVGVQDCHNKGETSENRKRASLSSDGREVDSICSSPVDGSDRKLVVKLKLLRRW